VGKRFFLHPKFRIWGFFNANLPKISIYFKSVHDFIFHEIAVIYEYASFITSSRKYND
jgi:hypothetical protein